MKIYNDIVSMQAAIEEINTLGTEAERIPELCKLAYSPNVGEMAQMDPFSAQYREKVLEVYESVADRKDYRPAENELAPYLSEISDLTPGYYLAGSTTFVGDVLTAMGQVLKHLDAKPGQRILEYGAGEGGIALEAAKAGCEVTVVDIEPKYLELIARRAEAANVSVRTVVGEFGHDVGGGFDRILFYEAFHHALDHAKVARQLNGMLAPGGYLVLAGEPVFGAHNEHWRATLPYPWGLRLDGLSFRAIQTYGWMELGFDEGYLVEMLTRAGFHTQYHPNLATDRAAAYIAHPYGDELSIGSTFAIAASGRTGEWHVGEGEHRWTAADEAVLPLCNRGRPVELTFSHYGPEGQAFEIEANGELFGGVLARGETRTVTLPPSDRIYIRTKTWRVDGDPRSLGLAVRTLKYV